ncbi:unnamed protein product [Psylliodes chrysocephalus]|uniref:Uncharacterized protein n=1 Tax=Psylliodes chrysocephalus TaxID=3402493 RepID=A0A9P0CC08_9CUCU|nr:unnamed protein product [Psylliodes chrysocephala]
MITDERVHIRELGIRRILKARQTPTRLRTFRVPKINFEAQDYTKTIHWSECNVTEPPPLTKQINDQVLEQAIENKSFIFPSTIEFPCHTQAVKRCVKLVTEASSKVCGSISRDSYIRVKLEAS